MKIKRTVLVAYPSIPLVWTNISGDRLVLRQQFDTVFKSTHSLPEKLTALCWCPSVVPLGGGRGLCWTRQHLLESLMLFAKLHFGRFITL